MKEFLEHPHHVNSCFSVNISFELREVLYDLLEAILNIILEELTDAHIFIE